MNDVKRNNGLIIYNINGKKLYDIDNNESEEQVFDFLNKINDTINFDIKQIYSEKDQIEELKQEIENYILLYLKKMKLPAKVVFGINTQGIHGKNWFIFNGGDNRDIMIDSIKLTPLCAKVVYDSVNDIIDFQVKMNKDSNVYQDKYNLKEEIINKDETLQEFMKDKTM